MTVYPSYSTDNSFGEHFVIILKVWLLMIENCLNELSYLGSVLKKQMYPHFLKENDFIVF